MLHFNFLSRFMFNYYTIQVFYDFASCRILEVEAPGRHNFDNEVIADPQIMCTDTAIGIDVRTQKPFLGRMFINGMSDYRDCVQQFNSRDQGGYFMIPFGRCDMRATRVLFPQNGLEYSTTMVVSFHPELLTLTDRAFHIKCRYYQADRSIGSYFEVSVMPTVVLTDSFPMPSCRYTLHILGVDGPPAQFAKIGDPIYHRWECDSELYGIAVKSCFVDDGRNRRYQLVDDSGCASDYLILPDITYDPRLNIAHVKTNVFKFADRANVFFQCQIALCFKANEGCRAVTPPNCDPRYRIQRNRIARGPRKASEFIDVYSNQNLNNQTDPPLRAEDEFVRHLNARVDIPTDLDFNPLMDVTSPKLVVLDIGDDKKFDSYVKTKTETLGYHHCDVCLPAMGFAVILGILIVSLCFASAVIVALFRRQQAGLMIDKMSQIPRFLSTSYTGTTLGSGRSRRDSNSNSRSRVIDADPYPLPTTQTSSRGISSASTAIVKDNMRV